jgi:biopolymer transport protein ExbB/TolQ
MCVIITIIMVYSVIQPVITSIGLLVGILLYVAYKFVIGWCTDQPDEVSGYAGTLLE